MLRKHDDTLVTHQYLICSVLCAAVTTTALELSHPANGWAFISHLLCHAPLASRMLEQRFQLWKNSRKRIRASSAMRHSQRARESERMQIFLSLLSAHASGGTSDGSIKLGRLLLKIGGPPD